MNKKQRIANAKERLRLDLEANIKQAIKLSPKAFNKRQPCFVGSSRHVDQLLELAVTYSEYVAMVLISRGEE